MCPVVSDRSRLRRQYPSESPNGERHRDTALGQASGEFVAQIAYDDLWFPDHLKELAALLAEVEFGNLTLMAMTPDGAPLNFRGDLADPDTRQRMLSQQWNFFGPTVTGYRLSTYRRLAEGWAPAPPGIWSDLHMWRKFLRLDGVTTGSRPSIQSLCLHNSLRRHMTPEQRHADARRFRCARPAVLPPLAHPFAGAQRLRG